MTASKAALEEAHAEAKRLKNEGNKAFMARRWAEAATEYTAAIELWHPYATKLRTTLDAAKKNHEVAVAKARAGLQATRPTQPHPGMVWPAERSVPEHGAAGHAVAEHAVPHPPQAHVAEHRATEATP